MSTGEGPQGPRDAHEDRGDREDRGRRGERIGIGGGDDSVLRIQLAARWAEAYGPDRDSLGAVLKRFRATYEYLDSVTHGVEPPDLASDMADQPRPGYQSAPPPQYTSPPQYSPPPSPVAPPPPTPQTPPRPWS